MANYTTHLLRSNSELQNIEQLLGNKLALYKKNIENFVSAMPCDGSWICFHRGVPPANIPIIIKLICHYIDTHWDPNDLIEFNNTATMLRRKRIDTKEGTYAKYYQEKQNSRGPFSH